MRFLFVRPEFCPLGDLSTPKIRLSSDSTSRWTPLPLASPSRYRADSGLSPYRTCAHRAHINFPLRSGACALPRSGIFCRSCIAVFSSKSGTATEEILHIVSSLVEIPRKISQSMPLSERKLQDFRQTSARLAECMSLYSNALHSPGMASLFIFVRFISKVECT